MAKRVFWKKGMRLTDEVLRLSDRFHADLVGQSLLLSAAGRFGLLPSARPFRIALNFNKNFLEVVALDCLGLTRNGQLVDVSFDSRYTQYGDTRIAIPQSELQSYLLLVSPTDGWRDTGDGACEPVYQFVLSGDKTPVPDDALPVARIVNETGWKMDDAYFVPPCLYLASHDRYLRQCGEFKELLARLDALVPEKLYTDTGVAMRLFWPEVKRLRIVTDKEADIMTPMSLLARIQECVSAFFCACSLDEYLSLTEADRYQDYILTPYDFKDCALRIQEGLALTADICQKLENFVEAPPVVEEAVEVSVPFIQEGDQHIFATNNDVRLSVFGMDPGAECYYSLDGSEPSQPLVDGRLVPINPGFNKTRSKEEDRTYLLSLKAYLGGTPSKLATYEVVVTKDVNVWKGFQI
jgi:hypothetical protein